MLQMALRSSITGIDRLCCCTTDGKLRFYSVRLCTAAASDIQTSDVTTTSKVAEDATTEAANGSDAINTGLCKCH